MGQFYIEHFPQNPKLTLDRPHRIRRTPVDQVTPRVRRAFVEYSSIYLFISSFDQPSHCSVQTN